MHRRPIAATALALAALVPASVAAAAVSGTYKGTTDQGFNMKLTAKAGKVRSFSLPYDAKCESGKTESFTLRFKGSLALARGKFVDVYKGDQKDGDMTYSFDQRTTGKVTSGAAKGTHRTRITVTAADGSTDSCDTGPVAWELNRA